MPGSKRVPVRDPRSFRFLNCLANLSQFFLSLTASALTFVISFAPRSLISLKFQLSGGVLFSEE